VTWYVNQSVALDHFHSRAFSFSVFVMLSVLKKPDNIGFDVRGDVKIFDFGLAREFPPDNIMVNGTYQMSGKTGMWCRVVLYILCFLNPTCS
jgi:serine/threonine protein kinase